MTGARELAAKILGPLGVVRRRAHGEAQLFEGLLVAAPLALALWTGIAWLLLLRLSAGA